MIATVLQQDLACDFGFSKCMAYGTRWDYFGTSMMLVCPFQADHAGASQLRVTIDCMVQPVVHVHHWLIC
jgi:hypothetical protein